MISKEMLVGLVEPHLAELPEATRATVLDGLQQIDVQTLMLLVADASEAAQLRANGDEAGCQEILNKHRALVAQFGLGDAFDAMFATA